MQNANLLLYLNLSGEVFYIIAHRMKSQKVSEELQQRVYNDLAVAICHPTVIQNIIKGSLQLLELDLADVRTVMDRIVHSSIMTVNAFSMEKLFELTLIATRYQYTVCQHPKDILLIALNHLDSIRKSINDAVGIQLAKNLHATLTDRMKGLNNIKMQDYRYAILTYLGDVKLKMTNLIRLCLQKPTGEFVKIFPDKTIRPEFKKPGYIEMDDTPHKKSLDEESETDSDSNGEDKDDNVKEDCEEDIEDDITVDKINLDDDEDELLEDTGCHLEPSSGNPTDPQALMTYGETDEVLEILTENEFSEFHEQVTQAKSHVIQFCDTEAQELDAMQYVQQLKWSLELDDNRGITLGLSIYDIPGNSDEDISESTVPQKIRSMSIPCYSKERKETSSIISIPKLNDVIDLKAVQGLDLCSVLLGCESIENTERNHRLYHSPAEMEYWPDSTIRNSSSGEESSNLKVYKSDKDESDTETKTQASGINIVRFDARTDRSGSKAALAKISKEFDIEPSEEDHVISADNNKSSPFDLIS